MYSDLLAAGETELADEVCLLSSALFRELTHMHDQQTSAIGKISDLVRKNTHLDWTASQALFDAGVLDSCRVVEFVERRLEQEERWDTSEQLREPQEPSPREALWARVLESRPKLLLRLSQQTDWLSDVQVAQVEVGLNLTAAAEIVARRIAALYEDLNSDLENLLPGVGLVLNQRRHDRNTVQAMACICSAFGIPHVRTKL